MLIIRGSGCSKTAAGVADILLSLSVSVCLSVSLSPSVCLSVSMSLSLCVCVYVCVCLSLSLSLCPSPLFGRELDVEKAYIYLSITLVNKEFYLIISLSFCLSLSLLGKISKWFSGACSVSPLPCTPLLSVFVTVMSYSCHESSPHYPCEMKRDVFSGFS